MEPETLARAGSDEQAAGEPETLKNYIGGGWVEIGRDRAASRTSIRRPADARAGAAVGRSRRRRRRRAARAAQPAWRAVAAAKRARAVFALREALWAHQEELARLVTEDMGKTLDDARGEVGRGIESTEAACGDPAPDQGREPRGRRDAAWTSRCVRQPVGVVAAITPFNFPAMIPLWFLPYAIACGNTFILKPSERDPRTVAADLRAHRRDRRDPGRRRQPRPRRPRRGQRPARPPRDRRDQLRRAGHDRAAT